MIGRKEGGGNCLGGTAVWLIVIALPPFILHHVPLIVQLLLRQRGQQVSHPVGFKKRGRGACSAGTTA